MTKQVNLELQRNASLTFEMEVQDTAGQPLDLTGDTFGLEVRYRDGDEGTIAYGDVTPIDAAGGVIEIQLVGSDFASVPGAGNIVRLGYYLIATRDGSPLVIARGRLTLIPGVS